MDNEFKVNKNFTHNILYNIIFCTRYRRNVFNYTTIIDRCSELIRNRCIDLHVDILSIDIHPQYVNICIQGVPDLRPTDIVHQLKMCTSAQLISEFDTISKLPNLWTRKFLIATYIIPDNVIDAYVKSQKNRY